MAHRNALALMVECQVRRRGCSPVIACRELIASRSEVPALSKTAKAISLKGIKRATVLRRYRQAMAEKGDAIRAEAELWARGATDRLIDLTFPDDLVPDALLDRYPLAKRQRGRP
jgi:hypothetical protein